MTRRILGGSAAFLGLLALTGTGNLAQAQTRHRDRPLTITRHFGGPRHTGIEVRDHGNEIIAWGGFSANGYGPPRMGAAAARREALNESRPGSHGRRLWLWV